MAWMIQQGEKCHQCGSYPEEWINEETKRPIEPPPMFVRSSRCEGCIRLNEQEDFIRVGNGGSLPAGMTFYLSRQPPPPLVESNEDEEEDEEDL